VIKKIWLYPPLAFARLGGSSEPCDNFQWAPSDATLLGNCRTGLAGAASLSVDSDGVVTEKKPGPSLTLKDPEGFRPVCPFFELYASLVDGDDKGEPVTPALLKQFGGLQAVHWKVSLANRKAYHFTGAKGDIVSAEEELGGGETTKRDLKGFSSEPNPLVPPGSGGIHFGSVQLTQFSPDFPQLRLRFTPPKGLIYAPTNLADRFNKIPNYNEELLTAFQQLADSLPPQAAELKQVLIGFANILVDANKSWTQVPFPREQMVLNPKAAWSNWAWPDPDPEKALTVQRIARLAQLDPATIAKIPALAGVGDRSQLLRYLVPSSTNVLNLPPGVFAYLACADRLLSGLGLLDDISDGLIKVTIDGLEKDGVPLTARARVAVTPPQVAPDRRSPLSLADGLSDRVRRSEVRKTKWVSGRAAPLSDAEVQDLLGRAFEAAGLQNADAVNDFFRMENDGLAMLNGIDPRQGPGAPWNPASVQSIEPMAITATARQHHRRMLVRQVLEDFVRSHPDWVQTLVRAPVDPSRYYDRRMPGLMRGFDRHPLALTRRQRDFLETWSARLNTSQPRRNASTNKEDVS
jgi:hypothetical protein